MWLGSIMHGWGLRMHGRDQKCMVEVENACWEGLVTWWAVGGVKVVIVVVVGCIMVLLVAISIVNT